MVAAVRRGDDSKVNGEKVRVLTLTGPDGAHCAIGLCAHQAGRLLRLSSHLRLVNFLWTVHPVSSASGKETSHSSRTSTRALWASTGGINEGPLCTTQAIMIQIGGYGTAVFSSVIAIHTFSVIVLQKTSPKFFAICVIVLGWAIPIGVDLIATFSRPRATPFYGLDHYWCWVRPITLTFTSVRLCSSSSSDSTRISHAAGRTPLPPDSPVSFHLGHLLFSSIPRCSGKFTH